MTELTAVERNTVLAALRCFQEVVEATNNELPDRLLDIATNGGAHEPMSLDDIDDLCERLNQ